MCIELVFRREAVFVSHVTQIEDRLCSFLLLEDTDVPNAGSVVRAPIPFKTRKKLDKGLILTSLLFSPPTSNRTIFMEAGFPLLRLLLTMVRPDSLMT